MSYESTQNYARLERLPLDLVLDQIPNVVDGFVKYKFKDHLVKVASLRLVTFKQKGIACKYCGLEATHFEVNDFITKKGKVVGQPHLNLWSNVVLMTKDHKIPTAKDGVDNLSNLVTCCDECNQLKKDLDLPSLRKL